MLLRLLTIREKTQKAIAVSGKRGSATFSNLYEFTAFELLPLIRKRDPEHADAIERDLASLRTLNAKYPNGLDSLAPKEGDRDDFGMQERSTDSMSFGPAAYTLQQSASDRQFHDFSAAVNDLLEKDPRQAIALSARLDQATRYRFLDSIIDKYAQDKPAIAHEAVAAYTKLADTESVTEAARHYLTLATRLQRDKLPDDTRTVLEQSLPVLAKDYDYDSGPKDPNSAPKTAWLSTCLYSIALDLAEKSAPSLSPAILQAPDDPDIKLLLTVHQILLHNHLPTGSMRTVNDRRPASAMQGYPLLQN